MDSHFRSKYFGLQFLSAARFSLVVSSLILSSCRIEHRIASGSDLVSSTDPVERSINSHSDLPEFKMTRELPDVSRRLTNWLNTCWLQAGVKELEFAYYKATGKGMPMSVEHIMLSALHDRYFRIIDGARVKVAELEAGGEMNEVRRLVRTYGMMPEATWSQPQKKWGDIAREVNPLAQKFRDRFRRATKDGRPTDKILADAEMEFQQLLEKDPYKIHLQTWFMDAGVKTTPVEFAKKFAVDDPEAYVMFIAKPMFPNKPTKKDLDTVQDAFRTSWENIEATIIRQIDDTKSVLFSMYWSPMGIKTNNGILTIVADPLPNDLEGHVVNIVGYHLNSKGRIDRLKIENTWGRYEGQSGFYSVAWKDFQTLYMGINVPDGEAYIESQSMIGDWIRN